MRCSAVTEAPCDEEACTEGNFSFVLQRSHSCDTSPYGRHAERRGISQTQLGFGLGYLNGQTVRVCDVAAGCPPQLACGVHQVNVPPSRGGSLGNSKHR
jgi:hypothetical protein